MGNYNPGRFRKQGREAFEPHCNPEDFCPYMGTGFWDESNRINWMSGWNDAQETWEVKNYRKQEDEAEFMAHSFCCPWHVETVDGNMCMATKLVCEEDNCAVRYWGNNG